MDFKETPDAVETIGATPGQWSAHMVGWWKWAIVSDEHRHIAIVENALESEREHVQANAQLMAASGPMLAALKAVDAHLIGLALKTAQSRGYDVTWQQAETMFGVSDLHTQIRQAIQIAEVGR